MAIVTPTDRSKSVRNRCVIKGFGGVFVLSRCFLDFSVGVGAFVIGLSQISSVPLDELLMSKLVVIRTVMCCIHDGKYSIENIERT